MQFLITNNEKGIASNELHLLHLLNPLVIQKTANNQYLFNLNDHDIKFVSTQTAFSEQVTEESGFSLYQNTLYFGKTWLATINNERSTDASTSIYFNVLAEHDIKQYCIDINKRNAINPRKRLFSETAIFGQDSDSLENNGHLSSDSSPSPKKLKQETKVIEPVLGQGFFCRSDKKMEQVQVDPPSKKR